MKYAICIVCILLGLCASVSGSDVVLGILGGSAFIECQLPVSDTLVWEMQNGEIIAMNGTVFNANSTKYVLQKQPGHRESLVIHNVTLDDDTVYQCHDITNHSAVDVTRLSVLVKPVYVNLTGPAQPIMEGQQITLVCEATGARPIPDIHWYRQDADGKTMEVIGRATDEVYQNGTGRRVNRMDAMVTRETYGSAYICNISVSVFYQHTFTLPMDVLLVPQPPVIQTDDANFDVGKPKTIECSSTGNVPTATIAWFLDGHRLGEGDFVVVPGANGTTSTRSSLTRGYIQEFDGSVLTCAVTNKVIQEMGLRMLMASITLRATYTPVITVDMVNVTVHEGENVTLRCNIDANPPVTAVYWLYEDGAIEQRLDTVENGTSTSTLTLHHVNRSASTDYTCHTSNRLGSVDGPPIHLNVQYKPRCSTTGVTKYAAHPGQNVSVTCDVLASPTDVTLAWSYVGRTAPLQATAASIGSGNEGNAFGTIHVLISSSADYGMIECKGSNVVGVSSQPCLVEIVHHGPPDPPSHCFLSNNSNSLTVTCQPSFNGGSKQHFILQSLDDTAFTTDLRHDIPEFKVERRGNVTVRVCAVNKAFPGIQRCAVPLAVTLDSSEVPAEPIDEQRKPARHTYVIAGVVTAAVGLVVISTFIICVLRKQSKERTSKEIAESEIFSKPKKSSRARRVWFSFKNSSDNDKPFTDAEKPPSTPAISRHQTIQTVNETIPYKDVYVLSSTPCYNHKHRIDRNLVLDVNTLQLNAHNAPSTRHDTATPSLRPDVLSESTGFAMSPIRAHAHNNAHSNSCSSIQMSDIHYDFEDTYQCSVDAIDDTDHGVVNGYNTYDIMEVLHSKMDTFNGSRLQNTVHVQHEVETMQAEYSTADIAEVLDHLEETALSTMPNQCQDANRREAIVNNNKDAKNDDEDNMIMQSCLEVTDLDEESQHRNTAELDECDQYSVNDFDNTSQGFKLELLRSPFRSSLRNCTYSSNPSPSSNPSTKVTPTDEVHTSLRKTFSLPYRSRKTTCHTNGSLATNKQRIPNVTNLADITHAEFVKATRPSQFYIDDIWNRFNESDGPPNERSDVTSGFVDTTPSNTDSALNNTGADRVSELEWDSCVDTFHDCEVQYEMASPSEYTPTTPSHRTMRSDSFMEAICGERDDRSTPIASFFRHSESNSRACVKDEYGRTDASTSVGARVTGEFNKEVAYINHCFETTEPQRLSEISSSSDDELDGELEQADSATLTLEKRDIPDMIVYF